MTNYKLYFRHPHLLSITQSSLFNLLLFGLISTALLILGCSSKYSNNGSREKTKISGTLSLYLQSSIKKSQTQEFSKISLPPSLSLHRINEAGDIETEALVQAPLTNDSGNFLLPLGKSDLINLDTSTKVGYVLKLSTDEGNYYRPLTGFHDQDISAESTLLALSTQVKDSQKRSLTDVNREEFLTTLRKIQSSLGASNGTIDPTTLLDDYIANTQIQSLYKNLTQI